MSTELWAKSTLRFEPDRATTSAVSFPVRIPFPFIEELDFYVLLLAISIVYFFVVRVLSNAVIVHQQCIYSPSDGYDFFSHFFCM